jgi:glycosyltransferase involved in cell wall biosynthesis
VNAGTDLAHLIEEEGLGEVYVGDSVVELRTLAEKIIYNQKSYKNMASRGKKLAKQMFSSKTAVQQIINAIK